MFVLILCAFFLVCTLICFIYANGHAFLLNVTASNALCVPYFINLCWAHNKYCTICNNFTLEKYCTALLFQITYYMYAFWQVFDKYCSYFISTPNYALHVNLYKQHIIGFWSLQFILYKYYNVNMILSWICVFFYCFSVTLDIGFWSFQYILYNYYNISTTLSYIRFSAIPPLY